MGSPGFHGKGFLFLLCYLRCQGLDLRPSACKACALSLSYVPLFPFANMVFHLVDLNNPLHERCHSACSGQRLVRTSHGMLFTCFSVVAAVVAAACVVLAFCIQTGDRFVCDLGCLRKSRSWKPHFIMLCSRRRGRE